MPQYTVDAIMARLRGEPARLGRTRLLLIDGPAGSGKTTLAGRIGAVLDAQVVHGDDIYEGWGGLDTMWPILGARILEPLARSERAQFERWDWEGGARGSTIKVPVADFLIIEGVGVAQQAARRYASLVVFVEAPWEKRLERGIERDGEHMRGEWEKWNVAEARHHEAEATRQAAHVIIDGTGTMSAS